MFEPPAFSNGRATLIGTDLPPQHRVARAVAALAEAAAEAIRQLTQRGIAGQQHSGIAPKILNLIGGKPKGPFRLAECDGPRGYQLGRAAVHCQGEQGNRKTVVWRKQIPTLSQPCARIWSTPSVEEIASVHHGPGAGAMREASLCGNLAVLRKHAENDEKAPRELPRFGHVQHVPATADFLAAGEVRSRAAPSPPVAAQPARRETSRR